MSFVSELPVGSLLICPKGPSPESVRARTFIRYDVKQARTGRIEFCARRLREVLPGSVLEGLLEGGNVLVPVPGHARRVEGGLWVAERICHALVGEGLGSRVEVLVERIESTIQSSKVRSASERPSPRIHYQTMRVRPVLEKPERILLVDDVVTRGSTLIGSATRLQEMLPGVEIAGFALARVEETDLEKTADMLSPKMETARYSETTDWVERR